ncbi:hypothetical protein [Microbulbifer taiwanensis]|uniref:Uncharacterized protein n=1 Tax=Microbulbifer taiwanensis TaxID=986746 RepID=A0ABW1YN29_9GAMM|nr:hypothetical protein [Microbulbifer taiwanensis]
MGAYKKLDPQEPAIEQIDSLYWLPFYAAPRHNYNLSGIYLSFSGEPSPYPYSNPNFIGYQTDIYSEESYPRMYGCMKLWDESSPYIQVEIQHLNTGCSFDIDDETAGDMGLCHLDIRLVKLREVEWEDNYDLVSPFQIKKLILRRYRDIKKDFSTIGDYFIPISEEALEEKEIKGRTWYLGVSGVRSGDWNFALYTALTPEHMLIVDCKLRFWPSDHEPSEKALKTSLGPLWDFLDNLEIDEEPGHIEVGVRDARGSLVKEETDTGDMDIEW